MSDKNIILNTGDIMPMFGLGNSNAGMPQIGLGTWKAEPNAVGAAVKFALEEAGYRHLDCAPVYRNEKEVGAALKTVWDGGKVKREQVFITSKLWNTQHAAKDVEPACRQTLADLQLDYLDLYLIHWGVATPNGEDPEPLDEHGNLITAKVSIQETWQAMEKLIKKGLVKAIGTSNFTGPMVADLLTYAKVLPAVNQIELHPYNSQARLVEYCQAKNIAVTAYSPLGSPGRLKSKGSTLPFVSEDPAVKQIAQAHNKSAAQVLLRWAIQRQTIVIPKSLNPEHLKNNLEVFDFELTLAEMNSLNKLDRNLRYIDPWDWWKIPYFD